MQEQKSEYGIRKMPKISGRSDSVIIHKIQQAAIARIQRLATGGNGKPLLSDSLIELQGKIPQVKETYATDSGRCALGALALNGGIPLDVLETSIVNPLTEKYNCTSIELVQCVKCPVKGCVSNMKSLVLQIPHLNDQHNKSFKEIGEWLKTYAL